MRRITLLFAGLLLTITTLSQELTGDWKGAINVRGMELKIELHFPSEDSGTIDIPQQNARGLEISNLERKEDSVFFNIPAPGEPKFHGKVYTDSITGKFAQMGQAMPFRVDRFSAEEEAKEKEALQKKVEEIRGLAAAYLDSTKTPAASVGIWYKGQVIMSDGFGLADRKRKVAANNETIYAIGSSSKAFTAMIISMLVDEGEINFDDKVIDHLPDFRLYDDFATQEMTVKDLLIHNSGLPRHDMLWYGSESSRDELYSKLRYLEPTESFRETFQYQNLMYMTAGILAERVTGKTWEELVKEKILDPLGMSSSSFSDDGLMADENAALGYRYKDKEYDLMAYRDIDAAGPAGSINSSSDDMLKWIDFLMNNGKVGEKELISSSLVKNAMSQHMIMSKRQSDPEMSPLTYGLGWMISYYNGHKIVQHGGNIDGFSALVFLAPFDEIGLVILTNKNGASYPSVLSMSIMDILVDDIEGRDWFSEGPDMEKLEESKEEAEPRKDAPHNFELEAYVGKYEHPGYGIIEIYMKDKELWMKHNTFSAQLEHYYFETFKGYLEELDAKFDATFHVNAQGHIDGIESAMEGTLPAMKFKKLPPPVLEDTAHIAKLTGDYDLAGIPFEVLFEEGKLYLKGQGNKLELTPVNRTEFSIKEADGFLIEFIFDKKGKKVEKFKSHQPNGTFVAERK